MFTGLSAARGENWSVLQDDDTKITLRDRNDQEDSHLTEDRVRITPLGHMHAHMMFLTGFSMNPTPISEL